jgi:hypothetical protein
VIPIALIVRSTDPIGLLFWCAIGFCAGIGLFFYGFRLLQRRRLILDTPFSKIRSASMGMVEVSGLAVGPYTVIAPITARPCYYYRTLVSEYKQQGKNKQWVKVAGECMHVPFFVDDNTGRLLVDPRGANLDLHCDFQQEFNNTFFSHSDAPANVVGFMARHGVATSNRIKVEEYCIKPKNSLFILGTLAENPGLEVRPEPILDVEGISGSRSRWGGISISINWFGMPTGISSRNREASFEQRFAERFNPPLEQIPTSPGVTAATRTANVAPADKVAGALLKAGISSPAAWAAAGAIGGSGRVQVIAVPSAAVNVAESSVMTGDASGAANGFDLHPRIVLMRGENNKTFLISWRSQREVASSLGWKCTLMIWGGPVLALISLYFFLGIEKLF